MISILRTVAMDLLQQGRSRSIKRRVLAIYYSIKKMLALERVKTPLRTGQKILEAT
jgi:hypothetical protein